MEPELESILDRAEELLNGLEAEYKNCLKSQNVSEQAKNLTHEALGKLRVALDHTMRRAWEKHVTPTLSKKDKERARVYFPITSDLDSFHSTLGRGSMPPGRSDSGWRFHNRPKGTPLLAERNGRRPDAAGERSPRLRRPGHPSGSHVTMLNVINTIAITLLVALVCVVPAGLLGHYVPGVFNPSLQRMAVAAWLSGLVSWLIARAVSRKQLEAMHQLEAAKKLQESSNPQAVGISIAFLAIAGAVAAVLYFFGGELLW